MAAPAPALENLRGARVLVAEDDPTNQLLVRDLLGRRGVEVTLAANGAEAVAAAAGGGFDLVLMDVRMPELDGLTACRRIRALPNGGLPIVALTANALAGERERCLAAGMDGYLTKPLEPETLYAELCRWLRPPGGEAGEEAGVRCPAADPGAAPGFDADKVRRWQDEFPDAWRGMVRAFIAGYPAAATAIRTALDAGDRARAGDLLHRLRGAGGALGAVELSEAAGRLELGLEGDGPVDASLRAGFFASAEATFTELARLAPPAVEPAVPAGRGPEGEALRQRLSELDALLEAGNTRALDHLSWLDGWAGATAAGEGRDLRRQIESLDFPAALETLRGLKERMFADAC
jgi:CheY-like chemotaxis protein